MWETTTRKPMLSLRLFGLFLLRLAQRTFLALLLNEPPRSTRLSTGCALHDGPGGPGAMLLIQPPNRRPNSITISEAWWY